MAAKKFTEMTSPFMLLFMLGLLGNVLVSAWFFAPPKNIARANGKPVDERCAALGQTGACEFYECFEQRLSCGDKGYMLKFGLPYCRRFHTTLPAFTKQGQDFVNGSLQCLSRWLLPQYQQGQVDCHALSHAAFDAVSSCYAAQGFCQVVRDNVAAFADVYQPKHLFQTGALKIWREIFEVTYNCDPDRVHNFASNALRILSRVLGVFTSDSA